MVKRITLAALFLAFCATASADSGWQYTGTSFEGFPLHTKIDMGKVSYRPTVVEYDVWNESNSIAFKENYVGSYYVIYHYTDEKGRPNGKDHNHQGEYASGHISLPHPPATLNPGKQRWTVKLSRNTSCGWQYDKPQAAMGTLYLKAGSTNLGSFNTDKESSKTFEFSVGNGSPGSELHFSFITLLAGKQQVVTYNYVWGDASTPMTQERPPEPPDEDGLPSWVWWTGGILLLLLLFRKKKK